MTTLNPQILAVISNLKYATDANYTQYGPYFQNVSTNYTIQYRGLLTLINPDWFEELITDKLAITRADLLALMHNEQFHTCIHLFTPNADLIKLEEASTENDRLTIIAKYMRKLLGLVYLSFDRRLGSINGIILTISYKILDSHNVWKNVNIIM